MKNVRLGWMIVGALTMAACASRTPASSVHQQNVRLVKDADTIDGIVPRNATLESLLKGQRIPGEMTASVLSAVKQVFNPRELRADQHFRVTRTLDGLLREFQYQIDADRVLRVIFHPGAPGPVSVDARVESAPKEIVVDGASADIDGAHTSLSSAFDAIGENVQLVLAVADIFAGEVDFNSDLQRGAHVDVLFERVLRDGQFAGYGNVLAATLRNEGKTFTAIRFPGPDGKPAWYDAQGRSLKRQFLRSPLRFDPRITSGYTTARVHPIYGDVRAHLGVDLEAPYGAPVIAVAGGVVEVAEMSGDAGRFVQIRHSGGYESGYLHLSAFAPGIHPGARVDQGQMIGRVGQSGAATGPHLDFRIWKNGVHVNPMTELKKMPPGEPIAPAAADAFARERDRVTAEMRATVALAAAKPHAPAQGAVHR